MAGGGGDVVPVSPRLEQPADKKRRAAGRRHQAQAAAACLPLDVIMEIAVRSDAATLVRCAAMCREARRRIAEDPNLRARLRLRDTGRFLLPLLRGHLVLVGIETYNGDLYKKKDVYLVDTTAADATHLVKPTLVESETLRGAMPMDSRGGLVLVRATSTALPWMWDDQLLVCNPATRLLLALPPEPAFPLHARRGMDVQFVLLAGDSDVEGGAAVGRPFQVLMAKLVLLKHHRSYRHLLVHTFSSEHGAWSPLTAIPTHNLHGIGSWSSQGSLLLHSRPLVVGDVVHWLCLTDSGSYLLMLDVRTARVNETALPASFPRDGKNHPYDERHQYLLATASAGGNPVVLVADKDKISMWEQLKHTKMWWPQVVIENQAIPLAKHVPDLVCFAERSGVVLLRIYGSRLLWLDLHSRKIVRSFGFVSYPEAYCPYEMDSSSWVPTFSRAGTF